MPKRSSKPKRPSDPNLLARQILEEAIGEPLTPEITIDEVTISTVDKGRRTGDNPPTKRKNAAAVALGRLGGMKGGPARAQKLSAKRKKDIARKAAEARWAKGK